MRASIEPAATEARRLQAIIAAVFFVLGGWCLVAPGSVIALTVREDYRIEGIVMSIAIGAFGAQAMLAGLLAATADFTRRTFAAFGTAMLPFFVFDWWFYAVEPVFNWLILLDAAGNVVMLAMCARGYVVLGRAADTRAA